MALHATLKVTGTPIGYIEIVRESGSIGKMNTYKAFIASEPHPVTGDALTNAKLVRVQHHYNEDPWALVEKVIQAVRQQNEPDAPPRELPPDLQRCDNGHYTTANPCPMCVRPDTDT